MSTPLIRTMSGQITTLIRDRILAGTYAPGAALLQDSIAAEFGVSKIPVREALVQLRAEGLVDVYAHRGFQVRSLSAEEAEEVFRLRRQIEPGAGAEGARRAAPEDHAAAQAALNALNAALMGHKVEEASDLNRQFHLSLVVPRVQPIAAEILSRLLTLSQRYVRMHLLPAGRIKRAIKEHSEMYEVWAGGHSKEVARLLQAHVEETREDLEKVFKVG